MAITSANVANAITKLVAADALPQFMSHLVVGNLVQRDYEPTVATLGETITLPWPNRNQSKDPVNVTLDTFAEASFQVPDVTKVLAVPDLLRLYMQPAVSTLAEKIEGDLLALALKFKAIGYAGTAITEATIDEADTLLFDAKVASTDPKYLVVDSNTYSQMRQIQRFSEFRTAGEAGLRALVDGGLGKFKDFYVFRSQFINKTGSGPISVNNMAFCKDAIGLIVRRLPQPTPGSGKISEYAELGNFGIRVTMHYQPNTLAQQFTIDILYGTAVLQNDHGILVRS